MMQKSQCLDEAGASKDINGLILDSMQMIHQIVSRYHVRQSDYEDFIQEGYIGLLDAIQSYCAEKGASFRTYANVCIDHRVQKAVLSMHRKKYSILSESLPLDEASLEDETQRDPAAILQAAENSHIIMEKINTVLSPFEREVLLLHLKELSHKDIALKMDCKKKAIDNALSRVRRKLK